MIWGSMLVSQLHASLRMMVAHTKIATKPLHVQVKKKTVNIAVFVSQAKQTYDWPIPSLRSWSVYMTSLSGQEAVFKMQVVSPLSTCLDRQVHKMVRIGGSRAEVVLNSTRPRRPGFKGHPIEFLIIFFCISGNFLAIFAIT